MKLFIFILLIAISNFAMAEATLLSNESKAALTIATVEIYQVDTNLDKDLVELPAKPTPAKPENNSNGSDATVKNPISEISIIIDSLLAIGKKIWPIIDAGRPVINTKLAPAVSIVPHLQDPTGVLGEMANWSMPITSSYRVSFKNFFGMEVVGFTYTLLYQYGGTFKGKGKYVTSLKVLASDIYTAWGFDFDAASELIGISNVGTDENPVASGIISVSYSVRGKLNEVRHAHSIYVDGFGKTQLISQ